jgi:hypothetical protein
MSKHRQPPRPIDPLAAMKVAAPRAPLVAAFSAPVATPREEEGELVSVEVAADVDDSGLGEDDARLPPEPSAPPAPIAASAPRAFIVTRGGRASVGGQIVDVKVGRVVSPDYRFGNAVVLEQAGVILEPVTE